MAKHSGTSIFNRGTYHDIKVAIKNIKNKGRILQFGEISYSFKTTTYGRDESELYYMNPKNDPAQETNCCFPVFYTYVNSFK